MSTILNILAILCIEPHPLVNMRYKITSSLFYVLICIPNLVNDPDTDIEPLGTNNVA